MINLLTPEQKTKFGIYGIRNIINNKYYIGQTSESFQKRFNRHNNNLINNKHHNEHLQRSYNKYGSNAFEFFVIEICDAVDRLSILEEQYILKFRSLYECYNILSGDPTMAKENNPMYGRKQTEEHRKKNSEVHKGLSVGEKCNFYREGHSGSNNPFYGHKHSEESRKKMSKAKSEMYKGENNPFYGKHHSIETKMKLANNGLNAQHREVMCVETGVVYRSISEAARQTNSNHRLIGDVCRGKMHKTNGLHWKYIN